MWLAGLAVAFVITAVFLFFRLGIDLEEVQSWMASLHGGMVFLLMSLLPLIGFPVSILHVVAGARFGEWWGLGAAGLSVIVNLLLTYWIGHSFLRRPLAAFFRKTKYKQPEVPKGAYASFSLLTALVPGIPYTAKNYLLVLSKVPFKPYFWVCFPVHTIRASLGIFFGGFLDDLTPPRIIFLLVYSVFILWLCRRVIDRVRGQVEEARKQAES